MSEPILLGKAEGLAYLLPAMANRHGLIAGATGTGKTVALQVIAEQFSRIGVPVFLTDVKGDLSGISQPGIEKPKITERLQQIGIQNFQFSSCPVALWDLFGEQGHPIRTTISDMGPLLLGRLLDINETQTGVLNLVFKIADDNALLLLDLKDLQAMLKYVGDNARDFTTEYGNISAASIGAIQRALMTLEQQGGDRFFGEPALDLDDMIRTDGSGRGIVNILAADRIMQSPRVYATFLLWLLAELFEQLPEAGDGEKPKFVFFFDEAHLLFNEAPKALLEKIEQVVRLIRSKGVGVYFITQNPLDIPDAVLAQLGNRIQFALRAFTPRDQKAVRAAATTFRSNPKLDIEKTITELGTGEALVSTLDAKGAPTITDRTIIAPPQSQIGPIIPQQRMELIKNSAVFGKYENINDRESAYELLKEKARRAATASPQVIFSDYGAPSRPTQSRPTKTPAPRPTRQPESMVESIAKSTLRAAGSQLGRSLIRGVLGSLLGGRRR